VDRPPNSDDREVIAAFRNLGMPFIAWGLGLVLIPFEVLILWGRWDPSGGAAWSAVALTYGVYFGAKGWVPWEMALNNASGRRRSPEYWLINPTACAVDDFLRASTNRLAGSLITATAALTPWLIMGASRVSGGRVIGSGRPLPTLAMAILGFTDAIRAGNLAMLFLTKRIERNWASFSSGGQSAVPGGLGGIRRKDYAGALILLGVIAAFGMGLSFLLSRPWLRDASRSAVFALLALYITSAGWLAIKAMKWLGTKGF
jgi:hypothetical protein